MEKQINISYSILVHNESDSLKKLLEQLLTIVVPDDEIIIVDDFSDNPDTIQIFDWLQKQNKCIIKIHQRKLCNDFASQKNFANSLCSNEWIFNIDSDELLGTKLLSLHKELIAINPEVELFKISRVNIVNGITFSHISKWGWDISFLEELQEKATMPKNEYYQLLKLNNLIIKEDGNDILYYIPIINWNDPQLRLFKNIDRIKWQNKVHEIPVGYKTYASFPAVYSYSILHYKDITKQEKQNEMYSNIGGMNYVK